MFGADRLKSWASTGGSIVRVGAVSGSSLAQLSETLSGLGDASRTLVDRLERRLDARVGAETTEDGLSVQPESVWEDASPHPRAGVALPNLACSENIDAGEVNTGSEVARSSSVLGAGETLSCVCVLLKCLVRVIFLEITKKTRVSSHSTCGPPRHERTGKRPCHNPERGRYTV